MAQLADTSLISDANLKAYYKLEDTSDSKGSNTLTNVGSTPFNAAKYGNGADFGSSNSTKYLHVASSLGVTHSAITMAYWMKINAEPSGGSFQYPVEIRTTGGGTNYIDWTIFYYDDAGTKKLYFDRSKPGISDQGPIYTVTLGTTNWHHLAMTYDGTNIHGYLDGVDVTGAFAASGVGSGGADHTYIGATNIPSNFSQAIIDDIAIFNRALTAAEILTLYNDLDVGGFYHMSL